MYNEMHLTGQRALVPYAAELVYRSDAHTREPPGRHVVSESGGALGNLSEAPDRPAGERRRRLIPDPKGAAPIALHPVIRRTSLDLRCVAEGERAIGYWIGQWIDIAARHPNESERTRAEGFASLLTPVAKAFFTANGFAGASSAL